MTLAAGVLLAWHVRRAGGRALRAENHALEAALAAAREATELKSGFLANMSHEIRTPIHGVLGMTELLLCTRLDSEQREYADAVRRSAQSLLAVINDILDLSKIEAGKLELEAIVFDLWSAVEEVAALMAFRAYNKKLELICMICPKCRAWSGGIPPACARCSRTWPGTQSNLPSKAKSPSCWSLPERARVPATAIHRHRYRHRYPAGTKEPVSFRVSCRAMAV